MNASVGTQSYGELDEDTIDCLKELANCIGSGLGTFYSSACGQKWLKKKAGLDDVTSNKNRSMIVISEVENALKKLAAQRRRLEKKMDPNFDKKFISSLVEIRCDNSLYDVTL